MEKWWLGCFWGLGDLGWWGSSVVGGYFGFGLGARGLEVGCVGCGISGGRRFKK